MSLELSSSLQEHKKGVQPAGNFGYWSFNIAVTTSMKHRNFTHLKVKAKVGCRLSNDLVMFATAVDFNPISTGGGAFFA